MRFVAETNLVWENAGIVCSSQFALDLLNPEIGGMKNGGFLLISSLLFTNRETHKHLHPFDRHLLMCWIDSCLLSCIFFNLLFSMYFWCNL